MGHGKCLSFASLSRYSWVPFTASFAGGALGGIAFWASKELYHAGAAYQEWAMAGATKGIASG
jgi:hypothetical protein